MGVGELLEGEEVTPEQETVLTNLVKDYGNYMSIFERCEYDNNEALKKENAIINYVKQLTESKP